MSSEEAEAPPPVQSEAEAPLEATPVQSDGVPLVDQDRSTKNVLVFGDPTITVYEKSLCARAAIYNLGVGFTIFAFSIALAANADVLLSHTHSFERGFENHEEFRKRRGLIACYVLMQMLFVILIGVIGSTFLQVNLDIVASSLVADNGLMGLSFQDDVKNLFATSDAPTIVKYILVFAYDVLPLSVAVGVLIHSATQVVSSGDHPDNYSALHEPDYKEFFVEYYLIGTQIGAALMMLVSVTSRIKKEFTSDASGSRWEWLVLFSPFLSAALYLLLISTVLSTAQGLEQHKEEPDHATKVWRYWVSLVLVAAPMLMVCKVFQRRLPSLGGSAFMAGNYLMMLILLLLVVFASGWLLTNDLVGFPTGDFGNIPTFSRGMVPGTVNEPMHVRNLDGRAGAPPNRAKSSFISTKSKAKHGTSRQKMHESLDADESSSSHHAGWSHQVEHATSPNDILLESKENEVGNSENNSQNFFYYYQPAPYYSPPATEEGKHLPLNWFPPKSNAYPICHLKPMGNNSKLGVLDLAHIAVAAYQPTDEKIDEHIQKNFYGQYFWLERLDRIGDFEAPLISVFFPQDNVRVVAIRGTSKSDDMLVNLGLVAQIAVLQAVGYFVPILNFIPESSTRRLIAFRNYIRDSTSHLYFELLRRAFYLAENAKHESEKDVELVIVGHSLGGLLASIVTAHLKQMQNECVKLDKLYTSDGAEASRDCYKLDKKTHVRAVVFSAPGIYYNRDAVGLKSLDDLQRSLINVMPDNDIIPLVDKQVGKTQRINCDRRNAMYCHQLYQTVCELWRGCGDPKGRDYRNICAKRMTDEEMALMKETAQSNLRKFQPWRFKNDSLSLSQLGEDFAGGGGGLAEGTAGGQGGRGTTPGQGTFSFADGVPLEGHIRTREPPKPAGSEAFSGFTDQAQAADEEKGKQKKNTLRVDWKNKDKKNGLAAIEGVQQSAFGAS